MIRQPQWLQAGARTEIAHSKLSNVWVRPAITTSKVLSYSFPHFSQRCIVRLPCVERRARTDGARCAAPEAVGAHAVPVRRVPVHGRAGRRTLLSELRLPRKEQGMTLQRFLHRFRRAFVVGGAFAVAGAFAPGASAADVGVSIEVGQPGFYGRIDIGNAPRPVLVYPEPVIVQPAPVAVVRRPIYLRVPPGHVKKWSKHCHRYAA